MDVEDDDAGGAAARQRDVGQDPRQRERRGHVAFRLHLRCSKAVGPRAADCGQRLRFNSAKEHTHWGMSVVEYDNAL